MLFSARLLLLVIAYYILLANGQQVGVSLQLLRQTIPNNSLVNLDDLAYQAPNLATLAEDPTNANGRQTLMCVTDLVACCETEALGNWYYPDGRIVTGEGARTFRTNRGQNEVINGHQFYGSVRLWRRYTPSERGLFRCELPDAENVPQTLYVNILFFTRIVDSYTASVAISPSGSTTAGETYSLTCSATLHPNNPPESYIMPPPTFEWFFGPNDNASLPSGLTPTATVLNSLTYTSSLQFSPLSQSHIGNYTCRLGAGSLVNSSMVTVNVPTLFVQITTSGALMLGQNSYSLTCTISGAANLNPSISYQWTKNNGTQMQIQVGRVLSFSPLRLSDAGQYTCQATVSSPYLINDITTMNSQDVTLQRNYTCTATVRPQPTSVYLTGNETLLSTISIKAASAPPLNVRATQFSSSAPVEVSWSPPFDGANSITGYRIFYGNGQSVLVPSVTIITSVSLKIDRNYVGQNVSIRSESDELNSEIINVPVTVDNVGTAMRFTSCSSEVGIAVGAVIVMMCLVVIVTTVIVVLCLWRRKSPDSPKNNDFTVSANMAYGEVNLKPREAEGEYENPESILKPSDEWTEATATNMYEAMDTSNPAAPEYASTEETVCATHHSS